MALCNYTILCVVVQFSLKIYKWIFWLVVLTVNQGSRRGSITRGGGTSDGERNSKCACCSGGWPEPMIGGVGVNARMGGSSHVQLICLKYSRGRISWDEPGVQFLSATCEVWGRAQAEHVCFMRVNEHRKLTHINLNLEP